MKKGMLKSISDSRRIKYSTLSFALCAIVVALAILLNTIVSALASRFNWYIDMTERQMFTLSEGAKAHLGSITATGVDVEIIFPLDEDQIATDFQTSSSSGSLGHIYKTALEIASECKNVKVLCRDTKKDFGSFYKANGLQGAAKEGHVLIVRKDENGRYATGDYRSYPINYFYLSDGLNNTLYSYDGELVFISALIALTRDEVPTVYFTIGHNELSFIAENEKVKQEGLNYDSLSSAAASGIVSPKTVSLMQIFADSGFRIKPLDLRLEEIPKDARMMVINQPTSDFTEDELYKLTTYLQNGGATFLFTPYDKELPNLEATIDKNYGVTINTSNEPIIDNNTLITQNIGGMVTAKHYLANVSMHDDGFASLKYFSAYASYSSDNARYNGAGTLTVDPRYQDKSGYKTGGFAKYTYPLLETSSTAKVGENGKPGVHTLMTITAIDNWSMENENSRYSYLVVCPSNDFVSNEALAVSDANRQMMLSLIQATSSVQTPVNLDDKPFVEYNLEITDAQARSIMIVLVTVLPLMITACGVVVLVRRKHK